MNILVTGGARSGKSTYAEQVACSLSRQRTYLATMRAQGAEALERIAHHRQQRSDLGFATIECACGLAGLFAGSGSAVAGNDTAGAAPAAAALPAGAWKNAPGDRGVVLLEDLGNLVANSLFDETGTMGDPVRLLDVLEADVLAVTNAFDHTVVVTNEVGAGGAVGDEGSDAYLRLLGSLACRVACHSDVVVEAVAGVPCVVKGELP